MRIFLAKIAWSVSEFFAKLGNRVAGYQAAENSMIMYDDVSDDLPVPAQFPLTDESLRLMYRPTPRTDVVVRTSPPLAGSAQARMRASRGAE